MHASQLLKPLLRHSNHAQASMVSGTCGQSQAGMVSSTSKQDFSLQRFLPKTLKTELVQTQTPLLGTHPKDTCTSAFITALTVHNSQDIEPA